MKALLAIGGAAALGWWLLRRDGALSALGSGEPRHSLQADNDARDLARAIANTRDSLRGKVCRAAYDDIKGVHSALALYTRERSHGAAKSPDMAGLRVKSWKVMRDFETACVRKHPE